MSAERAILSGTQIEAEGLADWRLLLQVLRTRYRTGDFATGLRLVNRIGEAAEAANHHPDLELGYGSLDIRLSSHDVDGVTQRDVRLARTISELAVDEGAAAEPSALSVVEIGLDTADQAAIKPFWRAVLGLQDSALHDDEVVDPEGFLPTLWFQRPMPTRCRASASISTSRVPHDEAFARVEAALAAGGTLVSDERAPSVLGARRRPGQQGLRDHLAGPRLRASRHRPASRKPGPPYQMLGRLTDWVDGGEA